MISDAGKKSQDNFVNVQLKREERWPHGKDAPSKITGLNACYTLMYGLQ